MTSLLGTNAPIDEESPRVGYHDRVQVPDGRIGNVVGFYKRTVESVLISFEPGVSGEFLMTEVKAL